MNMFAKTTLVLSALLFIGGLQAPRATAQDHPKNEVSKIRKDRADNHTVRQVTPDPKKSPGKHATNLSKNVNHETNRSSKHVNRFGKHSSHQLSHARHTNHTTRQVTASPNKSPGKHADNLSKNVNHETNRMSKDVNHAFQGHKDHKASGATDNTKK